MAVTREDLAPGPKNVDLGRKTCAFVTVLSIVLGLSCFVLCLVAEVTRSEVAQIAIDEKRDTNRHACVSSSDGSTSFWCAIGAFLGLATVMVVVHAYLLMIVSMLPSPVLGYSDPDFDLAKGLISRADFFYASIWVFFSVGEILLLIGLVIESGHLKTWSTPLLSCIVLERGIFSSAGVFALIVVLLAIGLYTTVLRAQRLVRDQEKVRHKVGENGAFGKQCIV